MLCLHIKSVSLSNLESILTKHFDLQQMGIDLNVSVGFPFFLFSQEVF